MQTLKAVIVLVALLTSGFMANAADTPLKNDRNFTPINFRSGSQSSPMQMFRKLMPRTHKAGWCDGEVCARHGCGCGPGYETDCCSGNCYTPPGNTYGQCVGG